MKQVKQGKKGKKSFLKSKKSLVAAALAALIALAGVTYAWFTWSVGVTGGTLKADYVQIDAEFGVYININKLFRNYAQYRDSNGNLIVPESSDLFVGSERVTGYGQKEIEIFMPFDLFQVDSTDLLKYLKDTIHEQDDVLYGKPLEYILTNYTAGGITPSFMVGNASGYTYEPSSTIFSDPVEAAKVFNRYVTHELPSNTLEVGYAIKNLGAACYINIPNLAKTVKISQATEGAGVVYGSGDSYVRPAWGVAQYGNYVYGLDSDGKSLEGWNSATSLPNGIHATGAFGGTDPANYKAVYDGANLADVNVPSQMTLGEIIQWLGDSNRLGAVTDYNWDYTGAWSNFNDYYQADGGLKIPLEIINKAYAVSASEENHGIPPSGIYNDGDFNVYPYGVNTKLVYSDSPEWKITVGASDVAGDVGASLLAMAAAIEENFVNAPYTVHPSIEEMLNDWDASVIGQEYYAINGVDFSDDVSDLYDGYLAGDINKFTALAYIAFEFDVPDFGLYFEDDSVRTPNYDLALMTRGDLTVLHVQGQAFTYKTLDTAPTINIKHTVKYGEYLDNRFVGSELYFDDAGVVAVQNTAEAAYDVFVAKSGNAALQAAIPEGYFITWTASGTGIKVSDISKLDATYINAITP